MDSLKPGRLSTQPSSSSLMQIPDEPFRKRILLTGLRRSGKTSVMKVIFGGMTAKETFYLEPSPTITKQNVDSLLPLQIWDVPPSFPINQLGVPLSQFSAIVFVLDFQDHWQQATTKLIELILMAKDAQADLIWEVFVHKSDTSSEDYRREDFRNVQQRILEGVTEYVDDAEDMGLLFRLTSIYDHTVFDAFSKVVQRLDPHLASYENLLNSMRTQCQFTKVYLFDKDARVQVAADSTPHDSQVHNLCCDYLQLLVDFSQPYSTVRPDNGVGLWASTLRLHPDSTIAYWQISSAIALVALIPTSVFDACRGIIEYNVVAFRDGVQEMIAAIDADRHERD